MLELKNVEANIAEKQVLRGVSIKVSQGAVVAVLGANGADKFSLIRVITGSLKATGGQILLDGREIQNQPSHQISRLGLATVPEGPTNLSRHERCRQPNNGRRPAAGSEKIR